MGILLKCISEAAENLTFLTTCSYGMYVLLHFCTIHAISSTWFCMGYNWSTLVLSPSIDHGAHGFQCFCSCFILTTLMCASGITDSTLEADSRKLKVWDSNIIWWYASTDVVCNGFQCFRSCFSFMLLFMIITTMHALICAAGITGSLIDSRKKFETVI